MTQTNPQIIGAVGGVPIVAEFGGGLGSDVLADPITLLSDYLPANSPGLPAALPTGGEASKRLWPLIPAGTTARLLKPEAAALLAAGAAVKTAGSTFFILGF